MSLIKLAIDNQKYIDAKKFVRSKDDKDAMIASKSTLLEQVLSLPSH